MHEILVLQSSKAEASLQPMMCSVETWRFQRVNMGSSARMKFPATRKVRSSVVSYSFEWFRYKKSDSDCETARFCECYSFRGMVYVSWWNRLAGGASLTHYSIKVELRHRTIIIRIARHGMSGAQQYWLRQRLLEIFSICYSLSSLFSQW